MKPQAEHIISTNSVSDPAERRLAPHYIEDDYDEAVAHKIENPVSTHDLPMDDPNWTMSMDLFDAIMKSL